MKPKIDQKGCAVKKQHSPSFFVRFTVAFQIRPGGSANPRTAENGKSTLLDVSESAERAKPYPLETESPSTRPSRPESQPP